MLHKWQELKFFAHELGETSLSDHDLSAEDSKQFLRALYELLSILVRFIRVYCDGYPIPCDVLIYNDENASIDLEQLTNSVNLHNSRFLIAMTLHKNETELGLGKEIVSSEDLMR